ncbi:GAF domain-containing protein [Dactylosporangium sp. AC04546]|uniref:sensor histidine kinase n=1 Tax=Dactylosporangium sp. AC04546 TaxID=2862460 RepID=UPI001EDDA7A7|nr:ATP-binding protein [Dactylosporangium sp. AC04546]WVK86316.1 GAF domain-containing protein [Dactylosporangium sp. AC04546]
MAAAVTFPIVAGAVIYAVPYLTMPVVVALGILGVAALTYRAGAAFGVPVALAGFLAFDWYYLQPTHPVGSPSVDDVSEAAVFLVLATAIGHLVTVAQRRELASEARRGVLADQQAALRRVATLVAQNATPAEVFAAVAAAVGGVLDADIAVVARYEVDASATMLATWERHPGALQAPVNYSLGGHDISTMVFQSQRPARMADYSQADSSIGVAVQQAAIRSALGAPIIVDQRLWGVAIAGSRHPGAFPADFENRICEFTELLATSIANTESRAELAASRARIIAAADETRRQLERDLHDGAQQRLISLSLAMANAESETPPGLPKLKDDLSEMRNALKGLADDLRELSRGIHPAVLSEGGLQPALKGLIRRSVVPVEGDIRIDGRLPKSVEVAAYYIVSEALTNVAKHARASEVTVRVGRSADALALEIRDDGVGGADPGAGSGLVGLEDRVKSLGGTIDVKSPPGRGTELSVTLPLNREQ